MTNRSTIFYEFTLPSNLNSRQENLCLIVEQLGPRLRNFRAAESDHERFVPSSFNLILIYVGKDDKPKSKIVSTLYGNEFKLTMHVNETKISRGRYLIMVQPEWHESCFMELGYRQIRTAVYSLQNIQLRSFDREGGLQILAKAFKKVNKGGIATMKLAKTYSTKNS
jgi:hypothetical protein